MTELNRKNIYSITQYKNGTHKMHDTVKVKSKSGKVIHVRKSQANDGSTTFWLGKKQGFELSGTPFRKSKVSVLNFLKQN